MPKKQRNEWGDIFYTRGARENAYACCPVFVKGSYRKRNENIIFQALDPILKLSKQV